MTRPRMPVWLSVAAVFAVVLAAAASVRFLRDNAEAEGPAYRIETIEMPEGLTAEVGGLDFLDDGRLVACFHRGEVMIYDPKTQDWKLFAQGLHDPLGLKVERDNEILVMQQPELTRVKDTDGDGVADLYESVTHEFGISGNYHEFNYGPVKDSAGNLFIALNTGSSGDGIRPKVRG